MRHIYHLIPKSAWDQRGEGPYRADSLATQGFIHCSNLDQVVRVANWFYADQPDMLLMEIDVQKLTASIRDEDPGIGERFPHVYGPINPEAIVGVQAMERADIKQWVLPKNQR